MNATALALMVMIGTSPPYSIGSFPDFQRCVAAAHGAVESLRAIEGQAVT